MHNAIVVADSREGAMKESGDIILSKVTNANYTHTTQIEYIKRYLSFYHRQKCLQK